MMNQLIFLTFLTALMFTSSVRGAVFLEYVEAAQDDPNACYRERDNQTVPVGESKSLPDCSSIECTRDNSTYMIVQSTCGVVHLDESPNNCTLVKDLSHEYPECCVHMVCATTEQ